MTSRRTGGSATGPDPDPSCSDDEPQPPPVPPRTPQVRHPRPAPRRPLPPPPPPIQQQQQQPQQSEPVAVSVSTAAADDEILPDNREEVQQQAEPVQQRLRPPLANVVVTSGVAGVSSGVSGGIQGKQPTKHQVKPFTKNSLERLESKHVQLVRDYGFQPKRKTSVEDGGVLPNKFEPFPRNLYGRPLEEIDNFIYDEVRIDCNVRKQENLSLINYLRYA
ncbi:hypothetical protein QAD02_001680 [Eretmocerus hayati]|uniref:Uncharacterized protein n=1 Tax=Eretmocerus hayati TaxID=131215 RepID=A0ACC2NIG9_9HYME|nr:hypothetical protein QAD02_001680 [Eretmocerus hayati]